MKYYKIETKISEFYKKKLMNNNSVTANKMGLEHGKYVQQISDGEFLENIPELSPFTMMGFGNITTWERFRFDVHNFIAHGGGILGFFISEKAKKVFETAKYGNRVQFYPAKLQYKSELYQYYIFQVQNNFSTYIDFEKSQFALFKGSISELTFVKDIDRKISSLEEYQQFSNEIYNSEKLKLEPTKIVFKEYIDFVFTKITYGFLVSENFKNILEEAQVTGIEFREVPIEFEVL